MFLLLDRHTISKLMTLGGVGGDGKPTDVKNFAVDKIKTCFPKVAAYEVSAGYTTVGLASGSTSSKLVCLSTGTFASPLLVSASRRVLV